MSFSEWTTIRIEDADFYIGDGNYSGKYPKAKELIDNGVPFISAKDFNGREITEKEMRYISPTLHAKLLKGHTKLHDVLIVVRGNGVGKVGLINEKYVDANLNAQLALLRPNPNFINPEYLYYLLSSEKYYKSLLNHSSGSAQPQLTIGNLKKLEIKFPDIVRQKKIVNLLSSLDKKIESNSLIIKKLEEISQALFKRWFIDFEFVNDEKLPYKSSGGKMVDSELGELPLGWHVGTAKEIFDFSPTEKVKKGDSIPYVEMKNLNSSAMIYEWTHRDFSGSGSKFKQGDTLLARITPCLENGKIGYVDFLKENQVGWGSTEFIIIRSKPGIKKSFSYFFASESNFKDYAVSNMNGSSGRQRVKAGNLADYKMIIPPIEIINQYTEITEKNMKFMSNLKQQILYLKELRDSLLPKLLTGEVEIPDESVVN